MIDREIVETALAVERADVEALSDAELLVLCDALGVVLGEEIVKVSDREAAVQRKLAADLSAEYVEGVDAAADAELAGLPDSDVSPDEAGLAVRGVGERLDRDLEGSRGTRMRDALLAALAALTLMGRKRGKTAVAATGRSTASISGSLTQVDRNAVDVLSGQQLWWIGEFWGEHLSKTISATITRESLVAGLGVEDVGRILRGVVGGTFPAVGVPGTFPGSAENYFTALAGTVRNQASNYGVLGTFVEAGIERYRIVAVLDKRTSEICFAPSTPVLTPLGKVPIGDVVPGQLVVTGSGLVRRVRGISRQFSNDWRRITLSSGCSFTVTPGHPFLLKSGWTCTDSIEEGDELAVRNEVGEAILEATGTDGYVQGMRRGVPYEGTEGSSVLLGGMLYGEVHAPRAVDRYDRVRAMRKEIRCSPISNVEGSRAVLQSIVSSPVSAQGNSVGIVRSKVPDVRSVVSSQARGASNREASGALLARVSETSSGGGLWDVRDGVRGRGAGAGESSILLDVVLPEVEGRVDSGDDSEVDSRRSRVGVRGGGSDRSMVDRLRSSSEYVSDRDQRTVHGNRSRERSSRSIEAQRRDRGTWANFSQRRRSKINHERRGELPVREYLARASGFDRVLSIERLTIEIPAINLDVDDDPTYVAAGCIVHNCNFMHGRSFTVRAGARLAVDRLDAETPEDVRNVSRWRSAESARTIAGDENPEDALTRVGMALPPYHGGNCRTTIAPE